MRVPTISAVAATGMIGTGFKESSLRSAAVDADFIAADAGSTDPGPYYLGSGASQASIPAMVRDLRLMLTIACNAEIPLIIGSAGTAGGKPHVDRVRRLIEQIAEEEHLSFPMAVVNTEVDQCVVTDALRAGRLRPLENAPRLDEATIMATSRIVAMAGPEPFEEALKNGAQVILAGRSSDTSLFVALPHLRGIPLGVAYHAAKVLECGAAAVAERLYPDSMVAKLDSEGFTVEPPNPAMRCTPQSVAAHTLYENGNPFLLVEPGGSLDTSNARYSQVGDRAVRVTGSLYVPASEYTVRLEAASLRGYRTAVIAGMRDPVVLRQIDSFLGEAHESIRTKVSDSLNLSPLDYTINWRVYGRNGCMGPLEPLPSVDGHEVGIVIDVVGRSQEAADAIAQIAWHTALHQPIREYRGLISNLAFPFSPPTLTGGPVYEFSINHALVLTDPADAYDLEMIDVGNEQKRRVLVPDAPEPLTA